MHRHSVLFAAIAALLVISWLTVGWVGRAPSTGSSPAFLGTWTDVAGPPGNLLRLQLVPRSSSLPGIQLLEGKGQVQGLFGEANTAFVWNYESDEPLRLNVVIATKTMVAPVRMLGPDRMLIRWVPTADVKGWSSASALEGPGAVILTRAKVEPGAP